MSISYRNLIVAAGGNLRPGEKLKQYLGDLSEETEVDIYSLWKAWRGEYMSRRTKWRLEKAAHERAKRNDYARIACIAGWLSELESTDEFVSREEIDAARCALGLFHRLADARSRVAVCLRGFDDAEEEEGD